MAYWICVTCGSQFTASQEPPQECPICRDQRQYIGYQGQQWTTLVRCSKMATRIHLKRKSHT